MASKNSVFWEALILTIAIFVIGLFIGIAYESNQVDEINEYYANSEISLMDTTALGLINKEGISCEVLIDAHISFADQIYEEARLLGRYEDASKIDTEFKLAHRRYDLLRTILWIDTQKTLAKCEDDFSTIIYLYELESEDLGNKAEQRVWSKVLFDLKQEEGDNVILIPIAVDSDLISLNLLLKEFNLREFPAVIINDESVIYEIISAGDLKDFL